ncbi:RagB/SusD family nutrient uptake outer membrane protein [Prevotella histicola]|uniref:RagB/SusD family nutrient uptake outer membrane protein n=1 Tax=Prevotella histicola TaxID=470565 RepID=UPI001C6042E8|nr:RagB/SusD family nutrient uptake outer membrane protein [Prevotella histicola]MBW4711185.1 RagB/SusD family nutrient uptake outer membrane protein [Prevotella histicola]MBW4876329.1 RagB/SusD family nutrient uptake outer membrane protein [Prevotella histicola]MBW4920166.1 RagB/SusD family nutrient uptake outer membrane protein [Prevotella histicola]
MNTKFFRYVFVSMAVGSAFTLCSCNDFLDREEDSFIDKTATFDSYNRTKQYLTYAYSLLPEGLNRFSGGALLGAATDDACFAIESSNIQQFNNGSWNALNNPDNVWDRYFAGIAKCCTLLENSNHINLDISRLDPAKRVEYENNLKDIRMWRAEAHFLRAYFNFELLKRYGPIPIIKSTLDINKDYSDTPRPTMKEVVEFIANDCDMAADSLELTPWRNMNDAFGRATKGAALALKSRLLLYAASPLYVDFGDIDEANKPSDATLWKAAADAAKAVIDLNQYELASAYDDLFKNDFQNKEYIFVRRYPSNSDFEKSNFPVSYGGKGGTNPSQNLIDDYEMLDGTAFDWSDPVKAAHPFENRDERLLATVLMNGVLFKGKRVATYPGGADAMPNPNATKTGYYLRKFLNENVNIQTGGGSDGHVVPLFRLAEIYLNYAEALNEYDPTNPDIAVYLNKIRERVSLPDVPSGLTQEQMRTLIHHERRVELAFEEHRFWDVRRWKVASSTLGAPVKGVKITQDDAGNFTYSPVQVEQRVFQPKMYWYPIPQSEVLKLHHWEQNKGW